MLHTIIQVSNPRHKTNFPSWKLSNIDKLTNQYIFGQIIGWTGNGTNWMRVVLIIWPFYSNCNWADITDQTDIRELSIIVIEPTNIENSKGNQVEAVDKTLDVMNKHFPNDLKCIHFTSNSFNYLNHWADGDLS